MYNERPPTTNKYFANESKSSLGDNILLFDMRRIQS